MSRSRRSDIPPRPSCRARPRPAAGLRSAPLPLLAARPRPRPLPLPVACLRRHAAQDKDYCGSCTTSAAMSPRDRSRGALISAAASLRSPFPPRPSSAATNPRGCPRRSAFAAAVLRRCSRRQAVLPLPSLVRGDVTPRLSARSPFPPLAGRSPWLSYGRGRGGGPPLPLPADCPRSLFIVMLGVVYV